MSKQKKTTEVIAHPNFPAYSISAVGGRYVIVGGGGGAARTGIKNKFDVYELYHNGEQTAAERVISHDVGDACVSNHISWCDPKSYNTQEQIGPSINLALGQEDLCDLLHLTPKVDSSLPLDDIILEDDIDDVYIDNENSSIRSRFSCGDRVQELKIKRRKQERLRRESINSTLRGDNFITFDIKKISSCQSVSRSTSNGDDTYQKTVRVSHDFKMVCTGGTDGRIRLWAVPSMKKIGEIKAHAKEVDDLDFKPNNKQIVSVCKPSKECCIWNIKDMKKFMHLELPSNGVKNKFYKARYGVVEDKSTEMRLFTVSNAISGFKHPGVVCKWNTKGYELQKTKELHGTLSSLAVSDNGRYLATGTMNGTIYILISFSLQVFQKIEKAHSTFVTGLEWLPTADKDSKIVTGFSDASVLSISCDHSVKIHHIPRQDVIPVWAVALLSIVLLFGTYVLASYIGV